MLPKLPPIRELIKIYGLSAQSRFSQNFILDKNITDKIVRTAKITPKTPLVVEVGPGPGLLSRSIIDSGAEKIVAIEKDSRFLPTLQQLSEASGNRFRAIHGDALTVDYQEVVPDQSLNSDLPIHIMGNLPFNVASPLLLQWLHQRANKQALFGYQNDVFLTLMFQKEVGDRIIGQTSTSKRGRLSVMSQSLYHVKEVYKVPSTVFVPKPKVDASVIQFSPKPFFTSDMKAYKTLENMLRCYFVKRRKTMGHITRHLAKQVPELNPLLDELESIFDFQARPEDIPTEKFCEAAILLYRNNIQL